MSQPRTSSRIKSSKSDSSKVSKSESSKASKSESSKASKSDSSKVHKLALKGSSKVVNEFVSVVRGRIESDANRFQFEYCINTILCVPNSCIFMLAAELTALGSNEVSIPPRTSQREHYHPSHLCIPLTVYSVKKYGLTMMGVYAAHVTFVLY
jgi:hypothetical protein